STSLKFSEPTANVAFIVRRSAEIRGSGKSKRLYPDGFHATPVPVNWLRAPFAETVHRKLFPKFVATVPVSTSTPACPYQNQCWLYVASIPRTAFACETRNPRPYSKNVSARGMIPCAFPAPPPTVNASEGVSRYVALPIIFSAFAPNRW